MYFLMVVLMRFAQVELHQLRSSSTKANESAFIHIQSSHSEGHFQQMDFLF